MVSHLLDSKVNSIVHKYNDMSCLLNEINKVKKDCVSITSLLHGFAALIASVTAFKRF
jgi:hypothetical protein